MDVKILFIIFSVNVIEPRVLGLENSNKKMKIAPPIESARDPTSIILVSKLSKTLNLLIPLLPNILL